MNIRVFKDGKTDFIAEWLADLPKKAKHRFESILVFLTNERSWRNIPYVKKLTDCDDIFELIITCDNIQYRPLGCYGPGKNEFILLIGATKKGRTWVPPDARQTAKKRRKLIHTDKDRRYIGEYDKK